MSAFGTRTRKIGESLPPGRPATVVHHRKADNHPGIPRSGHRNLRLSRIIWRTIRRFANLLLRILTKNLPNKDDWGDEHNFQKRPRQYSNHSVANYQQELKHRALALVEFEIDFQDRSWVNCQAVLVMLSPASFWKRRPTALLTTPLGWKPSFCNIYGEEQLLEESVSRFSPALETRTRGGGVENSGC